MTARCGSRAEAAPPEGDARRWLRVLVDPLFGRYLAGRVVTSLGIWIFNVVAVVVAYDLTGSAFVTGVVTAAQFAPQIVLAPVAGAAADRWDRRVQVAVGQLVAASGSGGLAVWLWTAEPGAAAAVPLVLASAIVGIGHSITGPAMMALVPALVRPAELHAAVTLGMVPVPLGRAVGPILGTTLAVSADPAVAFAVTSGTTIFFLAMVLSLPASGLRQDESEDGDPTSAWGYLRANRRILVLLLAVAAVGVGTDPAITLAPAISSRLGSGTSLVGPIATAFGVGAGVGFALIPLARRLLGVLRYGYAGLVLMAAGMVLSAAADTVVPVVAGFVLAGAGLTLAMTGLSTALQMSLVDSVRGRVMALWAVAFVGTRPVAALVNGALTDALSDRVALVLVAVVAVAAAWLGLSRAALPPPASSTSSASAS